MKYLLISFNSRNSLFSFSKILKYNGIQFSIINTPRAIATSCGLSMKINFVFFKNTLPLINKANQSIIGVFICEHNVSGESYQKIF